MPRKRRTIPWLEIRDKTYYVFWTDDATGKTKRISLRTADSLEAQHRYAAFLAKGHEIFNPAPNSITVSQALDQYKTEHVDRNAIAHTRAGTCLKHLKLFFKDTPLSEIDIPASRTYADARRLAGVVDATIRRELVVLVAASNHALKWRRITLDKMPSIELPHEAREETQWLAKNELELVLKNATVPLRHFILIAYYTAGRRRSIEQLRRDQIDLRQGRINLQASDATVLQRKSKKRRPIVPLFPEIRPAIEKLLIDSPNEYLFGGQVDFYEPFKELLESLGLGAKAFPHVLRHSRATHLLQDGVSIYDVARLLGDTIVTVDRTYGHHSPEHLAETLAAQQRASGLE
jgi:integrase